MHLGDDDDPPYDPCTEDYTEVYLNRLDVRIRTGKEFTAKVLSGRLSGTLRVLDVCGTSKLLLCTMLLLGSPCGALSAWAGAGFKH